MVRRIARKHSWQRRTLRCKPPRIGSGISRDLALRSVAVAHSNLTFFGTKAQGRVAPARIARAQISRMQD